MNIQLIILGVLLIAYTVTPKNDKGKKQLIRIACFMFIVQSGLRHVTVGTDTMSYYYSFWDVRFTAWSNIMNSMVLNSADVRDPGYAVIVKAVSIIPSWQFFLVFCATFLYVGLGRLWDRYIENKDGVLFAAILWLALFNVIALSGMRQMLTTAFAFYITPYLDQKNWKVVLPALFLGSFVHVSFLFFLAFVPLSFINEKHYKKLLFAAILLVPVVGVMSQSIMAWMVSNMENDYYQSYAEVAEGAKAYTYVVLCTILSLFILFYNKHLKDAPKFFMIAAVMMTILVPLILRGGTAIRIGQYFTVYMMLSLPYIIERTGDKRRLYYISMIAVLAWYVVLVSNDSYLFFWDNTSLYTYGI